MTPPPGLSHDGNELQLGGIVIPPRLSNTFKEDETLHEKTKRNWANFKHFLKSEDENPMYEIVNSNVYQGIMGICLIIALFCPDAWILANIADTTALDAILTVVMGCFIMEMVLSCFTSEGYFLGFWFWADTVGCVSLLFELTWAFGVSDVRMREVFGGGAEQLVLMRSARAAKIGARAGRFSRVIKFLKFLPGMQSMPDHDRADTAAVMFNSLMTSLSTRVAMLTLVLVMVMPFLSLETYPTTDYSMRIWIESISIWYSKGYSLEPEVRRLKAFYIDSQYTPFHLQVGDMNWNFAGRPSRIANEFHLTEGAAKIIFDFTAPMRFMSLMNILLMLLVIAVMVLFALLLSNNISILVLLPLEQLLTKVRAVSEAIFKSVHEFEAQGKKRPGNARARERKERALKGMHETELLERAVGKLAVMSELAVATKAGISDAQMQYINQHDKAVLEYMQGAKQTGTRASQMLEMDRVATQRGSIQGRGSLGPPIPSSSSTNSPTDDPTRSGMLSAMWGLAHHDLSEDLMNSWNFNVLDLSEEQLTAAMLYLFCDSREACKQYVSRANILQFIQAAREQYMECPYHNWNHAVDVTHGVYNAMCLSEAKFFIGPLDRYALLCSACCHDVGHPGVNNPFLCDSRHDLAIQYNDISPLENHHCAKLFEIVAMEQVNIFGKLTREQYQDVRKVCIEAILHTDMKHHFGMVKDLQIFYELNSEIFQKAKKDGGHDQIKELMREHSTRIMIIQLYLHGADIGNSAKPNHICKAWASCVLEEFFAQGDKEKELGLPVQMLNDRNKVQRSHSQIGFIDFVIQPLLLAQLRIFPSLRALGRHLCENHGEWIKSWVKETSPAEKESGDMDARHKKLEGAFAFLWPNSTKDIS